MKKLLCFLTVAFSLSACGPNQVAQAPVVAPAPIVVQQDSGVGSALLGAAAGAAVTAAVLGNRNNTPIINQAPAPVAQITKNVTVINKTVNVTNVVAPKKAEVAPLPADPISKPVAPMTQTVQPTKMVLSSPIRPAIPAPVVIKLPPPAKKK